MKFPGITEYQGKIQNPHICFSDTDLKAGKPVRKLVQTLAGPKSMPEISSGQSAVVFQIKGATKRWAVRCFLLQTADQSRRYTLVNEYLTTLGSQNYLVQSFYLDQGIRVAGIWYPIVKMDWVEGWQLHRFVNIHLNNKQNLLKLAAQWLEIMTLMQSCSMAHGDLQHGNILVTQNQQIVLVDYDCMYVPPLRGDKSPERGHSNYQHPGRNKLTNYDGTIDNFSALIIYVTLLGLAAEPQLWAQVHADSQNLEEKLLLGESDYKAPTQSPVLTRLKQSPDQQVRSLANYIQRLCQEPVSQVPDLERATSGSPHHPFQRKPIPRSAPPYQKSTPPPTPSHGPVYRGKLLLRPLGASVIVGAFFALLIYVLPHIKQLVFTQAPDRLFSANRIISGEINEDSVMRLMYGTYDATSKRSTWDISKEGFDNVWGGGGFQTKTAYSSVNLAKYFQQAGIDRYIVVTETTEPNNDCHVCGIIIGGAVFSKVNNGWRLDALNKDITGLGAWGRGPGGELVKIGSNKYGVLFRSGDAHQGFTSEAVTIIGDVGNSIKELVTITDTAGGNGGVGHPDVPEFEYNSVIEFVPGNDTNYFDLSVTKSGTKMSENNTVVPFKEVRTYALIDSQYKERTANPLPPPPDQTAQAINLQAIENAPSTNQVTWKTYSDPAGRFQMEYPAEWTVAQENEDRRFNTRFTAPQPYVNLAAQIVLGGAERSVLESWQELHQQFQTTHGDGYQRVLLNEYTWAGQPAARWEFLLRGQHHPQVRQVGIRAWHQGVHYALFCTVPNETFAAWQSVCEHAIQSFRYLGLASLERDQRIWHALIRVRWHMDRGEYSDAVSELEKVKSLDPLNKEVFDLLARVKRAREAEARVLR